MEAMKLTVAAVLAMILAGSATAQTGGLTGAIDRQRQDMATQRELNRRELERQRDSLQQQQEQNLQFQLLLRQQPISQPPISPCAQVTGAIVCQ